MSAYVNGFRDCAVALYDAISAAADGYETEAMDMQDAGDDEQARAFYTAGLAVRKLAHEILNIIPPEVP